MSSPAEICVVDKQETEKHACLIFQKQLKVLVPSQGPALNDEVSASSSSSVELSEAKITGRPQMLSSDEVHTHTHAHIFSLVYLLFMNHSNEVAFITWKDWMYV